MKKRLLVVCALLLSSLAHADALSSLQSEDAIDEISAARAADEAGDLALKKVLESEGPRETKLVAVRASAHAGAPESLVAKLVELSLSRDPSLAPEAAWALVEIFERLTPSELSAREVLRADLKQACDAFEAVEDAPKPRADIALSLTFAHGRCGLLLGESTRAE